MAKRRRRSNRGVQGQDIYQTLAKDPYGLISLDVPPLPVYNRREVDFSRPPAPIKNRTGATPRGATQRARADKKRRARFYGPLRLTPLPSRTVLRCSPVTVQEGYFASGGAGGGAPVRQRKRKSGPLRRAIFAVKGKLRRKC